MGTNALQTMIFPILAGLGLGSALGMIGLTILRRIDALVAPVPSRPARRWRPVVVGLAHGHVAARPVASGPGRRPA